MPHKDPAARAAYMKKYYAKHQEARKAYQRKYRLTHTNDQVENGQQASRDWYSRTRQHALANRAAHRALHCGPGSACRSHKNMLQRCTNASHHNFNRYGGRLTPCFDPRWKVFANFHADMGPRPEGTTLHRPCVDAPYSKDNAVWSRTHSERCTTISRKKKAA